MLLAVWVITPTNATAQDGEPIRMVVGYAAGGSADQIARKLAQQLSSRLGRQVVIDNRPGASGLIAAQSMQSQPADGKALLFANASMGFNSGQASAVHPVIQAGGFNGLAPVATVGVVPVALAANVGVSAGTFAELQGDIQSPGEGTVPHSFALTLQRYSQGKIRTIVPQRGSVPAMAEALNNPQGLVVAELAVLRGHVASGRLKILAVSGTNVPGWVQGAIGIAAFGAPQAEGMSWYGVFAPPGTSGQMVSSLQQAISAALNSAEMQQALDNAGGVVMPGGGAQLAGWVERGRYGSNATPAELAATTPPRPSVRVLQTPQVAGFSQVTTVGDLGGASSDNGRAGVNAGGNSNSQTGTGRQSDPGAGVQAGATGAGTRYEGKRGPVSATRASPLQIGQVLAACEPELKGNAAAREQALSAVEIFMEVINKSDVTIESLPSARKSYFDYISKARNRPPNAQEILEGNFIVCAFKLRAQINSGNSAQLAADAARQGGAAISGGRSGNEGLNAQQIGTCSDEIKRTQVESQRWSGNANEVAARLGRFQKALFEGRCAGHPEASAYITSANQMIGYSGNAAASGGGPLPPLASSGNATASHDASRTRKVHNPAADAKGCSQIIKDADRQGANLTGNWRFVNKCSSTVEFFWCSDQQCAPGSNSGNTVTVRAGGGWPISGQNVHWGACRGRDGGGFDAGSQQGTRYTCHLLEW